jgi:hypothetical protein
MMDNDPGIVMGMLLSGEHAAKLVLKTLKK